MGQVEPAVAPPPGNPRFPLLDGVRAIAALGVVGVHVVDYTPSLARGWQGAFLVHLQAGVTIFFVLSGFLLYRPFVAARLAGREFRVRDYTRRRVLRIVPAYWAALTLLGLWPGLTAIHSSRAWIYYLYGQGYQSATWGGGLAVAWSLGAEVVFYAMLPLYALGMRRYRVSLRQEAIALGALFCGALVFRQFASSYAVGHNYLGQSFGGTADWFALGMALAVASAVFQSRKELPRSVAWIAAHPSAAWVGAAAVWVLAAVYYKHYFGTTRVDAYSASPLHFMYGVGALLVALPAVFAPSSSRAWVVRILVWPPVAWIGLVSYGIFLWHLPLIRKAAEIGFAHPGAHYGFLKVVAVAASIAAGAASYYLVERPFLRLKDRSRQRVETPPADSTSLAPN